MGPCGWLGGLMPKQTAPWQSMASLNRKMMIKHEKPLLDLLDLLDSEGYLISGTTICPLQSWLFVGVFKIGITMSEVKNGVIYYLCDDLTRSNKNMFG